MVFNSDDVTPTLKNASNELKFRCEVIPQKGEASFCSDGVIDFQLMLGSIHLTFDSLIYTKHVIYTIASFFLLSHSQDTFILFILFIQT